MDIRTTRRRVGARGATTTSILALLLVICLAESATGSCLSYGHSCWGAHGKRSARQPMSAPDWYLTRMLRRMVSSNTELNPARPIARNNDISAIFQDDMPDDSSASDRLRSANEDTSMEQIHSRNLEAKPMLDDELLSNIKLWQMMREASENK